MKFPSPLLLGLFSFVLFSVNPMSAKDDTRISKAEFERLWQTTTDVLGTVENYTQGKGDALTYEYEGHLNLCSDDIAVITVVSSDEKTPKKLRVSVARSGSRGMALLRRVGAKVKFAIPLLYMKYDPWGFVPSDDLKCISEFNGQTNGAGKIEPPRSDASDARPEPSK